MNNQIKISNPVISRNRIEYSYEILGSWRDAFELEETFFLEYSCDLSKVPAGIAIIPFICNILPIAWIYDATIYLNCCDKTFYESIASIKKGYMEMYPMMHFGGNLSVDSLIDYSFEESDNTVTFFSGGADAFNTLVNHAEEKPTLLTLWGADVSFEDVDGWKKVEEHLIQTAKAFSIDYITIKSSLRRFLNQWVLTQKVKQSGDGWWHGFQHGIGIISHAAPIAYLMKTSIVYFASSFTIKEKGIITCASDPTIDNQLRFCSTKVIHDGYEFDRQDKIHNITQFCKKTGIKIPMRVCWQSSGGKNCCECEKCWRTILEIMAEGEEPRQYDFFYTEKQLKNFHKLFYNKRNIPDYRRDSVYKKTQEVMRKNVKFSSLPKEIQWFYNMDIKKLNYHPFMNVYIKCMKKCKSATRKIIRIIKK